MVQYSAEYQLILGRVRVMPYYSAEYSNSTRHIPTLNHPSLHKLKPFVLTNNSILHRPVIQA